MAKTPATMLPMPATIRNTLRQAANAHGDSVHVAAKGAGSSGSRLVRARAALPARKRCAPPHPRASRLRLGSRRALLGLSASSRSCWWEASATQGDQFGGSGTKSAAGRPVCRRRRRPCLQHTCSVWVDATRRHRVSSTSNGVLEPSEACPVARPMAPLGKDAPSGWAHCNDRARWIAGLLNAAAEQRRARSDGKRSMATERSTGSRQNEHWAPTGLVTCCNSGWTRHPLASSAPAPSRQPTPSGAGPAEASDPLTVSIKCWRLPMGGL